MRQQAPNIKRALKRQEIVNRWTNILVVNEMRRLKKQRMICLEIVLDFERVLSNMTDDNYNDSIKYLESVLSSLEKIWM